MRVAREIPLNPNIVLFHSDQAFTTRIVEAFRAGDVDAPAPVGGLLTRGAVSVHMTRYRLSVRKPRELDTLTFLADIEPAVYAWSGLDVIPPAPPRMPKWREFATRVDTTIDNGREVYESSDRAATNPVASMLFGIDGVAELVVTPGSVAVGKGVLFTWESLAPAVERSLSSLSPD